MWNSKAVTRALYKIKIKTRMAMAEKSRTVESSVKPFGFKVAYWITTTVLYSDTATVGMITVAMLDILEFGHQRTRQNKTEFGRLILVYTKNCCSIYVNIKQQEAGCSASQKQRFKYKVYKVKKN